MNDFERALSDGKYQHPVYGVVSNRPHGDDKPNCDNYWLFTAVAEIINGGKLHGFDSLDFFLNCEVMFGLFARFPTRKGDDISADEIVGASCLSPLIADLVCKYGALTFWCFDLKRPGKFSLNYCIKRFIGTPGFIRFRANGKMGIIDQVLWSIGCVLSTFSPASETSGKQMIWVQAVKLKGAHRITDLAIRFFQSKMWKQHPFGPGDLLCIYYGEDHPFTMFAPKEW